MREQRVYRGTIEVVDRKGLIRTLDESGVLRSGTFKERLLAVLNEIVSLPDSPDLADARNDDLALDLRVPAYVAGAAFFGDLPIFWRPTVTVMARLRHIETGNTAFYAKVTNRMPWKQFISAAISFRRAFSLGPQFTEDDLEPLLLRACHEAIGKLSRSAAITTK